VHRDVSPQNVLIGIDGIARVLDFGVAKAAGRVQTTREGQVKGKIAYMPPEQIAGEKVDRRLDVYAASVVLWEALTAQRLFDGDNDAVVLSNVLSGEVKPPSALVSGLPPGVDEVVMKGLARNPKNRYATAAEMAVAVEDSLGIESPRKVSEFLQDCVGDAMAKRAARVKEIESNELAPGGRSPLSEGDTTAEPTGSLRPIFAPEESRSSGEIAASKASATAAERRKRAALVGLAIAGGLAVIILLLFVAFGKKSGPTTAASAAPTTPAPIPSPPAPVVQTAAAIISAAPSETATVASATLPPPTPSALWGKLPAGAWAPGGKRPDCTQPKVFVNGIWKFRPECMNQ
jgi:serine/threonine-protein kinase